MSDRPGRLADRLCPNLFPLLTRLWLVGVVWAAAGCGERKDHLLPVAGKVTLDGKPLAGGSVSFRPDGSRGNATLHHPTGRIDPAGNFQLISGGRKGAPPGWYKVLVFAADRGEPRSGHHEPLRLLVPEKYTRERDTDLAVEVVPAPAPGAYDLRLAP